MQDRAILASLLAAETPFEDGVLPLTAGGTGATSAAGALSAIGAAAASHTHAAADIVSGTIATARLGSGSATASTLLWGDQTWAALVAADLPSHTHAATDITTGTMATARLGSGSATASTLLFGDSTWAALAAADIPNLDASKITTGTMATARLGSGSASSTTALFGDQSYKTTPTGSGGTGRVVYWSGTNTQTSNANFTFDGSNLVVPGTIQTGGNPAYAFGSYTAGASSQVGYCTINVGGTNRKFLVGS